MKRITIKDLKNLNSLCKQNPDSPCYTTDGIFKIALSKTEKNFSNIDFRRNIGSQIEILNYKKNKKNNFIFQIVLFKNLKYYFFEYLNASRIDTFYPVISSISRLSYIKGFDKKLNEVFKKNSDLSPELVLELIIFYSKNKKNPFKIKLTNLEKFTKIR